MLERRTRTISLKDAFGAVEEHTAVALLHLSRWHIKIVRFSNGDRPVCKSIALIEEPLVLAVPRGEVDELELGRTQLMFYEHPVCRPIATSTSSLEPATAGTLLESFFVLYQPNVTIEAVSEGDMVQSQITIVYIKADCVENKIQKSTGACFVRGALAKTFPSPSSPCEIQPHTWFATPMVMVANIGNGLLMIRSSLKEASNRLFSGSDWIAGCDSLRLHDFTIWSTLDSPVDFYPYFWSVEDLMQKEMRGASNHFGIIWQQFELVDYFLQLLPALVSPSDKALCTLCLLHSVKGTKKPTSKGNTSSVLWTRFLFSVDLESGLIEVIAQYPPSILHSTAHIHEFSQQMANRLWTSFSGDWLSLTRALRHGSLTATNDISVAKLDYPTLNLSLVRPVVRPQTTSNF